MRTHFTFSEIKQLIDQYQQTMCVAIHKLKPHFSRFIIAFFFQHLFQRSNNQSQRSTKFVTDIGKETELHIIYFLILGYFQFYLM